MKICLLGDTHFGIRNDSKVFHAYYEEFYRDVFFPELERRGITTIIQLGDLFDRRKYINFLSLAESRRYFFDECVKRGITVHALIGNHDAFWRESLEINSPNLVLKGYDNIVLWEKPGTFEIDGIKIDMIPWICKDNEHEIFEFVKNTSSPICMGHFELHGFNLSKGVPSHDGIDFDFLGVYNKVYTGHYHTYSEHDNIMYLGTPYELFWSDYKDQKYFGVLNTDDLSLELVKNPNRMFHKYVYDDSNLTMEDIKQLDVSSYRNSYVKVVVVNKQNPYLFDKLLEEIYKVSPVDLTIVEDFTEQALNDSDEEIVNQAEDTMTILYKYIDTQSIDTSKDVNKLKTLMRELYVEALSKENIE
jgi:DNA repair exonuclease SbcCD nuclease subunit